MRVDRRNLRWAVIPVLLSGCGSQQLATDEALRLLAEGRVDEACKGSEDRRGAAQSRSERLEATRLWVDCLARRGELSRARASFAGAREDDAAALYGRGIAAFATDPAALPRAVALLDRAAERWSGEAEIPYRAGVMLLADEQSAEALRYLERADALRVDARHAVAMGHALLDLGKRDEALAQARRVVQLRPRPIDIRRGRALIQRARKRGERFPEAARLRYEAALKQQDRPGVAVATLRGLLSDFPNLARAHTLLGLCHLRLGNTADAIVAFTKAMQIDPIDATNPLYLAAIYRAADKYDKAIDYYHAALRLDPFLQAASLDLGELLNQARRPKEAAAVFEQLVALEDSPKARRLAGRAYLAADEPARAGEHFERLLESEPNDFEGHLRLAQILLARYESGAGEAGALESAKRHVHKAARIRPADPDVRRLLDRLEP